LEISEQKNHFSAINQNDYSVLNWSVYWKSKNLYTEVDLCFNYKFQNEKNQKVKQDLNIILKLPMYKVKLWYRNFNILSAHRRAAAVSVVKNGFPVPAAKITTLPFSKCLMSHLRIYGLQPLTCKMQSEPLLRCQYSPLLLEENSIHYSCQHPIKSKKAEECKLYSRDIKLQGKLLHFR